MAESEDCTNVDWCVTQTKTITIPFVWSITNFNFHVKEVGYSLKSSTFSSEEVKAKWYLKAFPKGNSKENENFLNLQLYFVLGAKSEVTAKFKCTLTNSNTGNVYKMSQTAVRKFSQKSCSRGWKRFIKTSELLDNANGLLPNDTLMIKCEITLLTVSYNTSGKASTTEIPECRLKDDLLNAFENSLFTDLTLIAGGKHFNVHRVILAARAPAFSGMIMTQMKVTKKSAVEIRGVDADGLYNIVHFIYSGDVKNKESVKIARDLLICAEKYFINRLKGICETTLCSAINIDNVLDMLMLADEYRASQLKKAAMDFIHSRMSVVTTREDWMDLTRDYPRLLNEVLSNHLRRDQNISDVA